jgi:MFS family permease
MAQPTRPAQRLTYAGGLSRAQVVAWRNAIFVVFSLCGLAMASWVSRVPAVRDSLHASTLQMALLIFGIAAGSIIGLVASSHIIARFGARTTIASCLTIASIGFALAGVGATVGPNFIVTFIGLAVFGASFGITDVSMNVLGAANERVLGRSIMPIFHAFFSFGTMIGAGLGALAEAIHLPIAVHTGILAVVIAGAAITAVRFMQSEHTVDDDAEVVPEDDHSKSWRGRLSIWRDPRTLIIGLIVLGMAFTEGSANDWLALATVDGHSVSNATGAIVFGVFVSAMTVGRLAGVTVLDRFGRVPALRGSAALAAIGLVIFIFVPNVWVATAGVVLWGLGSALGFPVGMSAAADDPKTAAARVSAVATIGYFAFLFGPPLIGFLGEQFGLLHALLVVLVLVALAGLSSGAARESHGVRAARP